jgi:hypothetical protein
MRKLVRSTILSLLLISCGTYSTGPAKPVTPCAVPVLPLPPSMTVVPCGDYVCIDVPSAVNLAKWVSAVDEVRTALAACPGSLVKVVPQ